MTNYVLTFVAGGLTTAWVTTLAQLIATLKRKADRNTP